jgi:hypothetical protein
VIADFVQGLSGIMRGMTNPDTTPAPSLPWYRAIVTRTPRGRKIRRRVALVLVVLTAPWWVSALFWSPQRVAVKLGLIPLPPHYVVSCAESSNCARLRCTHGRPVCLLDGDLGDRGTCACPRPPAGCREPRLTEDGLRFECLGGMEINGGNEREGGP